ncbi:MAG: phosphate acetyltransferase [Bacilli bacterium]|nr:phosphate acetyltransferase [Bacilli bacterium]
MDFINKIKIRAKSDKKTIVLTEAMDERVMKAAAIILDEDICNLIIIGNKEDINNSYKYNIIKATIIDPNTYYRTEELINDLVELRKNKGMTYDKARELIHNDYMYFACMLVKKGIADGIVSGACHTTKDTLVPALQIIKNDNNYDFVSSFFVMETLDPAFGYNGILVFSDCGIIEYPDSRMLAEIAGMSATSFKFLVGDDPIVAMLSYSTKGSAKGEYVEKVIEATKIAKEKYSKYRIDGELQLDTAIVPEIAKRKAPNSDVAGHANVLIFPNIEAGNIGYKLVERFAHAKAYGPITQGMANPVNDLSRGSSVDEIVGVVAITAVQAQQK